MLGATFSCVLIHCRHLFEVEKMPIDADQIIFHLNILHNSSPKKKERCRPDQKAIRILNAGIINQVTKQIHIYSW